MSIRDTRAGVRQAVLYEQNTSDTEKVFVELESLVMFFAVPTLVYYIKNGSSDGILLAAFQNIKWLIVVGLVAGILPMVSRKFRFLVAAISSIAAPIIGAILAWNLLHDLFWTILIAVGALLIIGGMNAGCLLWHEDMEATDAPQQPVTSSLPTHQEENK